MKNSRKTIINFLALLLCILGNNLFAQPGSCDPVAFPCTQNLICYGSFEEFNTNSEFQSYVSDFQFPNQSQLQTSDLLMLNEFGQYERNGTTTIFNIHCDRPTEYPPANSGERYAGMSIWKVGNPPYREGVSLPLNTPLSEGNSYRIELAKRVLGVGLDVCAVELVVLLSATPPCPKSGGDWNSCPAGFNPSLSFSFWVDVVDEWDIENISFQIPNGTPDLNYVTIHSNNSVKYNGYVLLDDFSLFLDPIKEPLITTGLMCEDQNVVLQGSGFIAGDDYWFAKGTPNGTPLSENMGGQHSLNSPVNGDVYYFVIDANGIGCLSVSDPITIDLVPKQNPNAGSNQDFCEGDLVELNGTYSASGNNSSYWTLQPSQTPLTSTTFFAAGDETNTYVFHTENECHTESDLVTYTFHSMGNVNAGEDVTICAGESVSLSATLDEPSDDAGYTFHWSPSSLLSFIQSTNGANRVTNPINNTVTFNVTAISPDGCTDSDQMTITVLSDPNINLTGDTDVCDGEQVNLTANYTIQGGETLEWLDATGTLVGTGLNYPFTASAATATTETYTFRITIRGCSWTESIDVNINPNPIVDLGPTIIICKGESVSLPSTVSPSGSYTYSWTTTGLQNFNGSITSSSVNVGPIYANQLYRLTATSTGAAQCSGFAEVTVEVIPDDNLVQNGDMELGSTPNNRSEIDASTGWYNVTGDPDLFDENYSNCLPIPLPACDNNAYDVNCMDIPCNHYGNMPHTNLYTGHRYAGLWTASGSELGNFKSVLTPLVGGVTVIDRLDARDGIISVVEAMGIKMPQALDPTKTYELTMYVSKAPKGMSGALDQTDSSHFKVKMNNYKMESTIPFQAASGFLIGSRATASVGAWEEITIIFQPNYAHDYLIIESTYPDNVKDLVDGLGIPTLSNPNPATVGIESYMYIDNIYIKEYCPVAQARIAPEENVSKEDKLESMVNISVFPNPTQGALTLQYQDLVSLRSQLAIVDASGNVVMKKALGSGTGSMSIDISDLPEGIYFYHVTDMNNELIKRDKIVLIK